MYKTTITFHTYCSVLETLPAPAFILDKNKELLIKYANPAFYTLLNITKDELQYKYGNRLHAITINTPNVSTDSAAAKEYYLDQQFQLQNRNTVYLRTKMVQQNLDGTDYLICVSSNMVREKVMERSLSDYRQSIEHISKLSHDEVFQYDIHEQQAIVFIGGSILDQINPSDQLIYGCFTNAVISKNIVEPQYINSFKEAFQYAEEGHSSLCELKLYNIHHESCWVRLTLEPQKDADGGILYVMGVIQDVTALKETAIQYLNEAQFFQSLLSDKDSYAQIDISQNKVCRVGGSFEIYNDLIGQSSYTELLEAYILPFIYKDDQQHLIKLLHPQNLTEALSNNSIRLNYQFRRLLPSNYVIWMGLWVHLFYDAVTKHILALIYIENIDQTKYQSSISTSNSNGLAKDNAPTNPEEVFGDILEKYGEMACLIDINTYELLIANKSFYHKIGLSKEKCSGLKCYQLMQQRQTPCPFCSHENLSTNKFYAWKSTDNAFGTDYLVKNILISWNKQKVLLSILIDISSAENIFSSLKTVDLESHFALTGVNRIYSAVDLKTAMTYALESVGLFYHAEAVYFWKKSDNQYHCSYQWKRESVLNEDSYQTGNISYLVNLWLDSQKWDAPVHVKNQEAMLFYSYELFDYMKKYNIQNQYWYPLFDENILLGILEIRNITANLENGAFLETFTGIIVNDWKKRSLLDGIVYASTHDELTGLLSRSSYEQFLSKYNRDHFTSVGVIVANINNLKGINANLGFAFGDKYIKDFACVLLEQFPDAQIFRLNGDEFLLIATGCEWSAFSGQYMALENIIMEKGSYTVSCGCSFDNIEKDIYALIDHASQSMHVNKKNYYDTSQISPKSERNYMLKELLTAIHSNTFLVFLQPKFDLSTNKLMGAEALIRYYDEQKGILTPDKFIDYMERNNIIRYIDLFVFETVCQLIEKWTNKGIDCPVISLNFSRLTLLEHKIISSMETILNKYVVDKHKLEIEITESMADTGKSNLYQTAKDLYKIGYSISLDDFGTKYTNLSILSELDIDILKLDKSLISSLSSKQNNPIILKNIISMCEDLNIHVIAEGIETKEQENMLRELGCHYGQGYLYGKPMPISDFEEKYFQKNYSDS